MVSIENAVAKEERTWLEGLDPDMALDEQRDEQRITVEDLIAKLAVNIDAISEVETRIAAATDALYHELVELKALNQMTRDQLITEMYLAGDKTKTGSGIEVRRVERTEVKIVDEQAAQIDLIRRGLFPQYIKFSFDTAAVKKTAKDVGIDGVVVETVARIEVRPLKSKPEEPAQPAETIDELPF